MPSDLDKAVRASKKFESLLRARFGVQGRGLHELLDNCERRLDAQTVRDLRFVATIRNKIVHEDGYDRFDDPKEFRTRVRRAEKALEKRSFKKLFIGVLVAIGLIGVGVITILILK